MALFVHDIKQVPLVADAVAARVGLERFADAVVALGALSATGAEARILAGTPEVPRLLASLFGNSPFLTNCVLRDLPFACRLLTDGPDAVLAPLFAMAATAYAPADPAAAPSVEQLMTGLRVLKRQAALTISIADVTGIWPLEQVTRALSDLADLALTLALTHLLRESAKSGAFMLRHPETPARDCGLVVLGMGKLGAQELNYSSDIDLIVLYDDEKIETTRPDTLQMAFVRLVRGLVRVLEERTADGYVFRTDLRLRPDPASTPLALSVRAAETYYESRGQNWERAAMIKARPVAGDLAAGDAFLTALRPYIWRRSLDFASIRDIQSIKRQINAHRGGGAVGVAGHNIKLGRGGIREIEFFAQTQQLIWGGREPNVRQRPTLPAIEALVRLGQVTAETAAELADAYRYLRRVEHRLQMIDDQQTQTLPKDAAGLDALARFLGYENGDGFGAELRHWLERVDTHYGLLFADEPSLGGPGSLVFTGSDDDPETLATLAKLGFTDTRMVSATVHGWHHGRYRSTRSARARELLTELMPALLTALAETAAPDAAFRAFDGFLGGLPAGVQIFSLFQANPRLLKLVAEIFGTAPLLAERLSRRPGLLDALLSGDLSAPWPEPAHLARELGRDTAEARDYQDVLDITRRWVNDHRFLIGVAMLLGSLDPIEASLRLSDVADTVLSALLPVVTTVFAEAHGRVRRPDTPEGAMAPDGAPEGAMAIVAFGKLGSRETTITSDLDLVMVYDHPPDVSQSDGPKPLPVSSYFIRLTQRLISAITVATGEGKLYEIDMRLRPSGSKGPLAVHIETFEAYEDTAAWTWEHMALTRARVIAGPPALTQRIAVAVRAVLTRRRNADRLLGDVADMRVRMATANKATNPWNLRNRRGGLIDAEFIAQYLVLRHAHSRPELVTGDTVLAFEHLRAAGCLPADDAATLIEATRLWRRLQQMLRVMGESDFAQEMAPATVQAALARAADEQDFARLETRMAELAAATYAIFRRLIERPARASAPGDRNGNQV